MGEVPGMVYVLGAYLAFAASVQTQRHRRLYFLAAGLVAGLALNAKLITFWSISGIFGWAVILWFSTLRSLHASRFQQELPASLGVTEAEAAQVQLNMIARRTGAVRSFELFLLGAGALVPTLVWELVHFAVLNRLTTFELYRQHAAQRLQFILNDGSGVGLRTHSGPEFLLDKFFLLSEVAHPSRWVTALILLTILLGGLVLLWLWRDRSRKQTLIAPIWLGWLANTIWFVALAKTGWPRHFWYGLVLAIILLSVILVVLFQQGLAPWQQKRIVDVDQIDRRGPGTALVVGTLLLLLICWGFASQPHTRSLLLSDDIVAYWQAKQIGDKYGASLPWIIIPPGCSS